MWRMPRSRDGLPGGCRRVVKSLEDAKPQQRPEIIRAWGQLEGRAASEHPDGDTAAGHPLPGETLHVIDADGAEQERDPASTPRDRL